VHVATRDNYRPIVCTAFWRTRTSAVRAATRSCSAPGWPPPMPMPPPSCPWPTSYSIPARGSDHGVRGWVIVSDQFGPGSDGAPRV